MATFTPRRGVSFDPSAPAPSQEFGNPSILERSLRSALTGAAADAAAREYYEASAAGDAPRAQAAGLRHQNYRQQAELEAPRIQSVGQVNNFGDAVDYGLSTLGAAPVSIVEPVVGGALGGLAASAIGSRFGLRPQLAGRMLQGGGAVGAVAPMYGQFRDAAATEHYQHELQTGQRQDPNAVLGTIQERGLAQAAPYLLSPMAAAPGRVAAGRSILPRTTTAMGSAAQGLAASAATDTASTLIGQHYRDQMDPNRNRSGDMTEIADEVIGGAVISAPFEAAGYAGDRFHGAARAAGDLALRGGQLAAEGGRKAAEYAVPRAVEAWENRPESLDEAAKLVGATFGELQNRGEDIATAAAAKRFTQDADVGTLLRSQDDIGADVEALKQDDVAKHAAAQSFLSKLADGTHDAPDYVHAAAAEYIRGTQSQDSWKPLSGALNDWQRSKYIERDLNELFKGKWEQGMQKIGALGGELLNAKDVAKDAYTVARGSEGRLNAQTPRMREMIDAQRDDFSSVLEKAVAPQLVGFSSDEGRADAASSVSHALRLWATNGFKLTSSGKPEVPARMAAYFKDPVGTIGTALDLMERQGVIEVMDPKVKARLLYVLDAKNLMQKKATDIVAQELVPTKQDTVKTTELQGIVNKLMGDMAADKIDSTYVREHFGPRAQVVLDALRAQSEALKDVETEVEREDSGTRTPAPLESDKPVAEADHEELAGMTDPFTPNEVAADSKWHHYNDFAGTPYEVGGRIVDLKNVDPETGEYADKGSHEDHADGKIAELKAMNPGSTYEKVPYMDALVQRFGASEEGFGAIQAATSKIAAKHGYLSNEEINRRFFVLRESTARGGEATDVSADSFKVVDPRDKRKNVWAEHVAVDKAGTAVGGTAAEGKIWLRTADGREFATSTAKIIQHIGKGTRREQGNAGDGRATGTAGQVDMLHQGLASMFAAGDGGEQAVDANGNLLYKTVNGKEEPVYTEFKRALAPVIGFRSAEGKPIKWGGTDAKIPDELRMYTKTGATYGDAKRLGLDERARELSTALRKHISAASPRIKKEINAVLKASNAAVSDAERKSSLRELERLAGNFDKGTQEGKLKYADERQTVEPGTEIKGPRSLHEDRGEKARTNEDHTGEAIGAGRSAPSDARKARAENAAAEKKGLKPGKLSLPKTGSTIAQRTSYVMAGLRKGVPGFVVAVKALDPSRQEAVVKHLSVMAVADADSQVWAGDIPKDFAAFRTRAVAALKGLGVDVAAKKGEIAKNPVRFDKNGKVVEVDAPSTLEATIKRHQDYLENPPADYTPAEAQKRAQWAEKQLQRVQAEQAKLKGSEDYDRLDQLSDYKSALKRIVAKAKEMIDADEHLEQELGPQGGKAKYNAQSAQAPTGSDPWTDAQRVKFFTDINRRLGPKIKSVLTDKLFGKDAEGNEFPISGQFLDDTISASIYASNVLQIGAHESMHALFKRLTDPGANAHRVTDLLLRAANSAPVVRQLERLLDGETNALKQIQAGAKDYAEERLAYMFQFHQAGLLKIGPETKTVFQKITDTLRAVFGVLSDDQKADKLLKAFDQGKMPDADAAMRVLERNLEWRESQYKGAAKLLAPVANKLHRLIGTTEMNMKRHGVKEYDEVVRLFKRAVGESGEQGFFDAKDQQTKIFTNELQKAFDGLEPKDLELAAKYLHSGEKPTDKVAKDVVAKLKGGKDSRGVAHKGVLPKLYEYMQRKGVMVWEADESDLTKGAWVPVRNVANYFPRVYDMEKLSTNGDAFVAALLKHNSKELEAIAKETEGRTAEDVAKAILARLTNSMGESALEETSSAVGFSPFAAAVNRRKLDWLHPEVIKEFGEKDVSRVMTAYIVQAVKRAEYTERFGPDGGVLKNKLEAGHRTHFSNELGATGGVDKSKVVDAMRDAAKRGEPESEAAWAVVESKMNRKDFDAAYKRSLQVAADTAKDVMAMEGTLGYNVNPTVRKINNAAVVYQNLRTLSTSIFSQVIDPMGMVARGAEMSDAWVAYKRGLKEVMASLKNEHIKDKDAWVAELVGTVDASNLLAQYGQLYGSQYMGGTFRRMNEAMFKYNGMEGFNRGMQIAGTRAAVNFLKRHAADGGKRSREYLAELNLKPDEVKAGKDGELDYTNPKIAAAIHQWVNGAVLRPNASQRTAWGSDPNYMMFWHMKQFAYTFHDTIIKRVVHDAQKYGDFGPAGALVATTIPLMIGTDAMKSLILTGDEPAWMNMGLDAQLHHGAMRAGLGGMFQPELDALDGPGGILGLGGPMVEQITKIPEKSVTENVVNALPGANVLNRYVEHGAP